MMLWPKKNPELVNNMQSSAKNLTFGHVWAIIEVDFVDDRWALMLLIWAAIGASREAQVSSRSN
jgi:hypothetical protein